MIVSPRSMSEADFRWNKGLALPLDVLRRRYDCAHRYTAERGLSNYPSVGFGTICVPLRRLIRPLSCAKRRWFIIQFAQTIATWTLPTFRLLQLSAAPPSVA